MVGDDAEQVAIGPFLFKRRSFHSWRLGGFGDRYAADCLGDAKNLLAAFDPEGCVPGYSSD